MKPAPNIKDGSNMMAEMATHCYAGNAARGMSLIALHNGGGVGIGKSVNGGFGLVLDGSYRVDEIIKAALSWDVMGGSRAGLGSKPPCHRGLHGAQPQVRRTGPHHPALPAEGGLRGGPVNRAFRG